MASPTVATLEQRAEVVAEEEARSWWLLVVTGALWLLFGFAVLNGREEMTTVWTVAVFAGLLFFLYGVGELVTAIVAEGWRWLRLLLGVGGMRSSAGTWSSPARST